MIALVNTDEQLLNDISIKLHIALNSKQGLRYVALDYGVAFQHPEQELYALRIIEEAKYYDVIIDNLTNEELNMMQELTPDWFELDV